MMTKNDTKKTPMKATIKNSKENKMVTRDPEPSKTGKKLFHNRNHLNNAAKSSMTTRIISSVVGLAILIPCIILGDWIYFGLLTIALLFATHEILGVANKRNLFIYIAYFSFIALIAYWPLFKNLVTGGAIEISKVDQHFVSIVLPIIVVVFGFFLLFALTVIFKDFTVQDAAFLISMGILIGFGFQCLFYLRYVPVKPLDPDTKQAFVFNMNNTIKSSMLLIFVIMSTFLTDGCAYFVGIFFGKNKMNERISPKKTWEGFVGGLVLSFLISSAIGLACTASDYKILPNSTLNEKWWCILILSFIIPLFATLGDFVFSSIKRSFGIKDYGRLIPGHGGVLDRLDSIIFVAIISAIFVFIYIQLNQPFAEIPWEKILV